MILYGRTAVDKMLFLTCSLSAVLRIRAITATFSLSCPLLLHLLGKLLLIQLLLLQLLTVSIPFTKDILKLWLLYSSLDFVYFEFKSSADQCHAVRC